MRYCPLASLPFPPSPFPPPLSPSHPLLVGNPTRVPGCSHNQISSHQKASEQTAGPFSWYSITDAAGRNYLCVPAQALVPLLLRDGLLHTESSAANGAVRRRSPAATQLLLSTISLFSLALALSLFVGASWWPSFWPFSAPIHCGRSAAHSAAGASRSIIHNPRATRRVPATPRPSTVAAIRFIILRHHTQR